MSLAVESREASAVRVHPHGLEPLLADALTRIDQPPAGTRSPDVADVHIVGIDLSSIDRSITAASPWIALLEVKSTALTLVARRAGACAIVAREDGLGALLQALEDVAGGQTLSDATASVDDGTDIMGSLSPRQVTVLTLITQGSSNDEIAAALSISPNTARTHVQNVLSKLGVRNRLAAAAIGRTAGLGR